MKEVLHNLSSPESLSLENATRTDTCFENSESNSMKSDHEESPLVHLCHQLLLEDPYSYENPSRLELLLSCTAITESCCGSRSSLNYPQYPLYQALAYSFIKWITSGESPIMTQQTFFLLNEEQDNRKTLTERLDPIMKEIKYAIKENSHTFEPCLCTGCSNIDQNSEFEIQVPLQNTTRALNEIKQFLYEKLHHTFHIIGERDVMSLLGLRQTVGSITAFPPPLGALLKSFTKPHSEKSKLTTGARALAKHCHRSTEHWWGMCTGTEEQKNRQANIIFRKIFNEIAWLNIHMLPHDVHILEVRTSEGFGARWSSDGTLFRGFLEPQMEDGHSKRWRH